MPRRRGSTPGRSATSSADTGTRGERLAHRQHGQLSVGGRLGSADPGDLVAGDGDEVAEHGARGRAAARARAVEHQAASRLRLDEHRVVGTADRGERMHPGNHRGVHPRGDAAVASSQIASSLTTQPSAWALAMSAAVTVAIPSRCTSAAVTLVWKARPARIAAFAAASKPSHRRSGRLPRSPVPGPPRARRQARARGVHLVEDVVVVPFTIPSTRRTASPARDSRSGRSSGSPGDRALVVQISAVLAGHPVQRGAVRGQQLLVGRDRLTCPPASRRAAGTWPLDAADQLDHDVDVGAGYQAHRVGGQQRAAATAPRWRPGRRTATPATSSRAPARAPEVSRLRGEQPEDLRAHYPAAEQRHRRGA